MLVFWLAACVGLTGFMKYGRKTQGCALLTRLTLGWNMFRTVDDGMYETVVESSMLFWGDYFLSSATFTRIRELATFLSLSFLMA